jgi:hypothetical protein
LAEGWALAENPGLGPIGLDDRFRKPGRERIPDERGDETIGTGLVSVVEDHKPIEVEP